MDEQGNDHDNQIKIAIYKAAPIHWSGWFNLLEDDNPMVIIPLSGTIAIERGHFTLLVRQVPYIQTAA
ncbi:hypothetical protein [Cytobacillus firmus]|jgi:hypothetical protein|uniref:hypothetical protein n=1 Tax=Cytobacillus firmus TaxID=1399 RepID=UPI0021617377|nr:hypothetical protein [Cytobacillus firmus]